MSKPARALLIVLAAMFGAVASFGILGASAPPEEQLIAQVPLEDILRAISEGKRVVFVDTREPQEYAESHIPGAVNYPSRAIKPDMAAQFEGAEYVIPYCLKDFRGFEGGKRLHRLGVDNVCLIGGFGISTWKKAELPVASAGKKTDEEALRELHAKIGGETALR